MALPTYVAAGAVGSGIGDVTYAIPATAQADDLLILVIETSDASVTAPSGWTEDINSGGSTGSTTIEIFYKVHSGSETDPTVTDPGNHQIGAIHAIRGADTADPFDVTEGGTTPSSSTTATISGLTTTVADCLIFGGVAMGNDANRDGTTFSNWTNADLANVTERFDQFRNVGDGGGLGLFTGEKATAGTFGDTVADTAVSWGVKGYWIGAIQPAAGGPTEHALAGDIILAVALDAAATRETSLAGDITVPLSLDGAATRETSLTGDVSLVVTLDGNIAREALLAAGLELPISLDGNIDIGAADHALAATLTIPLALDGAQTRQTSLAGDLALDVVLDGAASRETFLTGNIAAAITLVGNIEVEGAHSLAATLTLPISLDGTASRETFLAGDMPVTFDIAAAIVRETFLAGDVTLTLTPAAALALELALAGAIDLPITLDGNIVIPPDVIPATLVLVASLASDQLIADNAIPIAAIQDSRTVDQLIQDNDVTVATVEDT